MDSNQPSAEQVQRQLPRYRVVVEEAPPLEPDGLGKEAYRVLALACPAAVSELLSFCSYLITTAQVGKLGADALSAFTLACTMYHVTGLSLVVGLASGLDTFSGQAFGARQYRLVGVLLQRATLINILVASLVVGGWWFGADKLMLLLGQDPDIVKSAAHLLKLMSLSVVPWSIQIPLHSYFSTQGVVMPLAVMSGTRIAITPCANYIYINRLGLGLEGAALAYNALTIIELTGMITCAAWLHYQQRPGKKTWSGVSLKEAVRGWPAFLKIAVPGLVLICLDWWCFAMIVLLAGQPSNPRVHLGTMGVLFTTHALAFFDISGFGTAAATRVANELGAYRPKHARHAAIVCATMGFLIDLAVAVLLMLFRQPSTQVRLGDIQAMDDINVSMPFMALSVATDSLNAILSGVFRGCGHQTISLVINLFTFWVIGLPTAYWLGLVCDLGARGVWIALSGVSLLRATVLLTIICNFDWDKLASRAQYFIATGGEGSSMDIAAAPSGPNGDQGVDEPLLGAPSV